MIDQVKLMFLTKKSKLVGIINELKAKLNGINRATDQELRLKTAAMERQEKEIRHLKQEVLKAKQVADQQFKRKFEERCGYDPEPVLQAEKLAKKFDTGSGPLKELLV